MGSGKQGRQGRPASCALLTFHYPVKYSKVKQAGAAGRVHVWPCSLFLPCRQLIIYAKRVLSAFRPHTALLPLSSLSLSPAPPPPAVIVVLAFVLSARNVMRNCLCVLGVYDIIFVFLSVRLPPTLCVCCVGVRLCVYKLHYTTSNITNDNKHLADTNNNSSTKTIS